MDKDTLESLADLLVPMTAIVTLPVAWWLETGGGAG